LVTSIQHDPDEVRAFLLGRLGDEAADDFESRLFADDELLRRVNEGEDALVDQFVDGELSPDELQRFQELCRRSPGLQDKVAERRDLDVALQQRQRAQRRASWRWPRLATIFLPAATAAACVLVGVHVLHRPPQPAPNLSANVRQSYPKVAPPTSPPSAPVPVFFLADLVTRGSARQPVLKIPSNAARIELEIELNGNAAGNPEWSVEVTGAGHPHQVLTGLHPERIGPSTVLRCPIVAATLPDGIYDVRLTALPPVSSTFVRSFRLERTDRTE
jgi:hypothetical protein